MMAGDGPEPPLYLGKGALFFSWMLAHLVFLFFVFLERGNQLQEESSLSTNDVN